MRHARVFSGFLVILTLGGLLTMGAFADWKPADGPLMTRWAEEVDPEHPLPAYPRPMMVREPWLNLNGLWEYALQPKAEDAMGGADGQILVPFCIESALSGVMKTVDTDQRLWYRRTFTVPESWQGQRVLLHFGGVDWETTVFVNGKEVGGHQGGYDPFTLDITSALQDGAQELMVAVWDPTDESYQPRGKQVSEPQGIWYTAVTGIWQTVWLEPVPETAIRGVDTVADIDAGAVRVNVAAEGAAAGDVLVAEAMDGGKVVGRAEGGVGEPLTVPIEDGKLWSPDSPFLYDLKVTLKRGEETLDTVASYFGMRKIALKKDEEGVNRLFLNNEPLFQFGPLDQGWWPDGLYTAATDAALRYDVAATRAMGFNMARKHVKVEPARWYYHCDQLGLLVWQDMPSGDKYIGREDPDIERSDKSRENFFREWGGIIDNLRSHPSIVMWVPFNEGWGQFDTDYVTKWTKKYDPTRLVDSASGWTDRGTGDVHDIHSYPGPAMPPLEEDRAAVLGEFGGLGWPVKGHLWWNKRNWGYRNYTSQDELRDAYAALLFNLRPLIGKGLAAAVYTQTSDVEGEVNGLLTYDRDVLKMGEDWLARVNAKVYLPPPVMRTVVPTSQEQGIVWRYTFKRPGSGWEAADFDDSSWKKGEGGFGTEGTPGAVVRTTWDGRAIWLRRTFSLSETPEGEPMLMIHHDEDAEVYIDGVRAARLKGYTNSYMPVHISDEAAALLTPGEHVMAVRCHQTGGGQYIDVGLATIQEAQQ